MSEILIFIRKRESNGYRCKVWCCHKQPTTIHTTGETNVSCNWGKLVEHFVIPLDTHVGQVMPCKLEKLFIYVKILGGCFFKDEKTPKENDSISD